MRTLVIFGLAGLVFGCGGRERPPEEVPSAAQTRDFYGLNPDSCWRYRYISGGNELLLDRTVSEPNDRVVANQVVYIMKFRRATGGGLADEWYLDAETAPSITLRRSVVGLDAASRVTSRYEGTPPLFATTIFDEEKNVALEVGARFETDAMPLDAMGVDKPLESHRWTVQVPDEMVMTPDGMAEAYKLLYRKNDGSGEQIADYSLVPGFGFAKYTDFDGNIYQVCAARVCDSTGTCTGADDCATLACPR